MTEPDYTAAATELADSLGRLADLVRADPDLYPVFKYAFGIDVFPGGKATVQRLVRVALAARVPVTKIVQGSYFLTRLTFGDRVKVDICQQRDQVCERIVTGTETVTKKVPDPVALAAVPEVEVTETVETVEWRCRPIMAPAASDPVTASANRGA